MQQLYPLAAPAASFRRWALACAALLLALLLPGGAQATVYYVDAARANNSGDGLDWTTAKKDVQAAINLTTTTGDEVWVKAGTYLPTLVPPTTTTPTDARDQAFYLLNTDIKLYGGFAGGENAASQRNPLTNPTILSGDLDISANALDAYHVLLTLNRTSACVVDGFTVQAGRANGTNFINVQPTTGAAVNFTRSVGGGLYNVTSSPTVSGCIFSANTASSQGGGMYNLTSSPTVSGCTFSTNTASTGGGMFNIVSSPTVSICTFSGNTGNNGGGGMYNNSSSPAVSSCTFSTNRTSSSGQGGGMYNGTSSNPMVSSCTFSGNTATVSGNGGGMHNATSSSPTVSYCTFSGNSGGAGGGLNSSSSSPMVSYCTFSGNTGSNGGGMSNSGTGSPTVSYCTFSGNSGSLGGGMSNNNTGTGTLTVSSCTFSNNTSTAGTGGGGGFYNTGGSPTVSNCTFSGNTATGTTGGNGGALYINGGSPTVSSCTFSGNTTTVNGLGGGLYCVAAAGGTLTNCILYQNTTAIATDANREEIYKVGGAGVLTLNYCIVRDAAGTAPSLTVLNAVLTNCFAAAPGYVAPADADGPDDTWRTADDGLRLACASFAVDKGTGTTPATDILGNPRKGLLDLGAYEATGGTAPADAIPAATTTVSGVQTAAALPYTDCQSQLLLLDATSPYTLLGSTVATVRVLPTAPTFRTQPYVRRTYDIAPAANAATATAEVTLYFTQADFDDYNNARGSRPALPTTPADPDGNAANLRITQKHGSSATGLPGSYTGWAGSGPATVFITPTAVAYNATAARWEVRFPVTGFSGFFAHTGATPLPVELSAFTATAAGHRAVRLDWATASEKNSRAFEVERSANGREFERLGTVAAAGGSSARAYAFPDEQLPAHAATLYYRLRLVDQDGSFSYSPVRTVSLGGAAAGLALYPNPAHGAATLTGAAPGAAVTVFDALGRLVTTATADAAGTAALALPAGLPAGVYVVRAGSQVLRLTVE